MKEISVIIVNWNGLAFLRHCLQSIRDLGGPRVREVIVIDNASTDGSPEMVQAEFPETTLVRSQVNLGFARANNLGIQRASGRWLALVNSDVVLHAGCFDQLAAFLEDHPRVGLAGPKVLGQDGEPQPTSCPFPTVFNCLARALALDQGWQWLRRRGRGKPAAPGAQGCETVDVLSGCFWLARSAAVRQVGGLDERFFFYAEDVDWCKRMRMAGWEVVFVPKASATHFGGGSSANAPLRYSIEMLRADLLYWKKHHGRPGQAFFFVISVLHHLVRLIVRRLKAALRGRANEENEYRRMRSFVCLRWLVTGKEA